MNAHDRILWDNHKNIMRIGDLSWSGEIQQRWNWRSGEIEYLLKLDFVNVDEGWYSARFIVDEYKKSNKLNLDRLNGNNINNNNNNNNNTVTDNNGDSSS